MANQLDSNPWNTFISKAPGGSFLQSWDWGEFQEKTGARIWRLAEEKGQAIIAAALVIERPLPLHQRYLYVPRGPVANKSSDASRIIEKIVALARDQHAMFVRIEPLSLRGSDSDRSNLFDKPWLKSPQDIQPRHTLILDLTKSEEGLLTAMRPKTRYNIRLAEKKGVTIRFSTDPADLEHFLQLKKEVEARGQFHFHPDEYYRQMVSMLSPLIKGGLRGVDEPRNESKIELAIAEYQGEILAVHILVYFGDTATYLHGASSSLRRDLMAPHLLQWASIKRAKNLGYSKYDFWGISPPLEGGARGGGSDHPWAGITRFKEGFGGERVSYPGAYDYVLQPGRYWLYNIGRNIYSSLR